MEEEKNVKSAWTIEVRLDCLIFVLVSETRAQQPSPEANFNEDSRARTVPREASLRSEFNFRMKKVFWHEIRERDRDFIARGNLYRAREI